MTVTSDDMVRSIHDLTYNPGLVPEGCDASAEVAGKPNAQRQPSEQEEQGTTGGKQLMTGSNALDLQLSLPLLFLFQVILREVWWSQKTASNIWGRGLSKHVTTCLTWQAHPSALTSNLHVIGFLSLQLWRAAMNAFIVMGS